MIELKKLDGIAGVNLSEPSEGDLERVVKAYAECRKERDRYLLIADEAIKLFEKGGWYDYDDQQECGKRLRKALES